MVVEVGTDLGCDRKSRRNGKTNSGHLRKIGTFSAEQSFHGAIAIGLFVAKEVNVFRRFRHTSNSRIQLFSSGNPGENRNGNLSKEGVVSTESGSTLTTSARPLTKSQWALAWIWDCERDCINTAYVR